SDESENKIKEANKQKQIIEEENWVLKRENEKIKNEVIRIKKKFGEEQYDQEIQLIEQKEKEKEDEISELKKQIEINRTENIKINEELQRERQEKEKENKKVQILEQQKNEAIEKTRVTEEYSRLLEQQKNEAIEKTRVTEEQSRLLEQQKNEAIEKTRVTEEQSRLLEQQKNEAIEKTRVTEQQSRLLEQQKNEAIEKTRVTEQQSRQLEQQKNEAIEKTRVTEEYSRLLEQQKNEAIEKTRVTEEYSRLLEQQKNEVEQEKIKSEGELKKLNEQIKWMKLPDDLLKKFGEDLMKPLEGTKFQKKKTLLLLEKDCEFLSLALIDRKDDDGRKRVFQSDVIEGFINVFQNYELNSITRTYSLAFVNLINPSSDEIKLLIYNKKPYPGLIRLLKHTDNLVASDAIISILIILQTGSKTTPESDPHPHYETIQESDGIKKIFALFQKNGNKYSRDRSALCIGYLFKAREITDPIMRQEIIGHLKSLLNDSNAGVKESGKQALKYLAQNATNRSEILNEQELNKIEQDLKYPIEGTQEQQKNITQRQETDLLLLSLILEGRNDNELRKRIISSGVIQVLINIIENRDLKNISSAHVKIIYELTNNTNDEIKMLLAEKKPFSGLIRLLEHTDEYVQFLSINSIYRILEAGANSSPITSQHPYFDSLQQSGDIERIFELYRKSTDKSDKEKALYCLCILFRAREITDPIKRQEIISHHKSLLNDSDAWVKERAKDALKYLSQNA
ncbi:MAG: hypothetical protein EZS28_036779, partial [Streblomastix strix]